MDYFSVADVVGALTDSNIPRNYWSNLKRIGKSVERKYCFTENEVSKEQISF